MQRLNESNGLFSVSSTAFYGNVKVEGRHVTSAGQVRIHVPINFGVFRILEVKFFINSREFAAVSICRYDMVVFRFRAECLACVKVWKSRFVGRAIKCRLLSLGFS
jgi:hypothetical protein